MLRMRQFRSERRRLPVFLRRIHSLFRLTLLPVSAPGGSNWMRLNADRRRRELRERERCNERNAQDEPKVHSCSSSDGRILLGTWDRARAASSPPVPLARGWDAARRADEWPESGRRGSNPRPLAWEAEGWAIRSGVAHCGLHEHERGRWRRAPPQPGPAANGRHPLFLEGEIEREPVSFGASRARSAAAAGREHSLHVSTSHYCDQTEDRCHAEHCRGRSSGVLVGGMR
jgi:hypothetical protein